jgi:hypothetical protein
MAAIVTGNTNDIPLRFKRRYASRGRNRLQGKSWKSCPRK